METAKILRYEEIFKRNFGFLSIEQQELLRRTPIFVCGVGGMGGACLVNLVRAGCENLAIADIDSFEVSNLNRQIFSNLDSIGKDKAEASIEQIAQINPNCKVTNFGSHWLSKLDEILAVYKVVVNGTDDLRAGIQLYRKAREHNAIVIDAYTSPLPSVYVTKPTNPYPEERLNYPTVGLSLDKITKDMELECKLQETTFVVAASSSMKHIDISVAKDVVSGLRPRMSFAPMVIGTGTLMSYQAIAVTLNLPLQANNVGYFLDAYSGRIERPLPFPFHQIKSILVKAYLKRLIQ